MRVALVGKLFPPHVGGVERHMDLLARHLAERHSDISVEVIVGQDHAASFREEWLGSVRVHRATTVARIASTPIALGLPQLLKSSDADLFHFHFPYPWGELAALRARIDRPFVVTYHMDIVRQKQLLALYQPFLHRFLIRADRIVAFSPQLRNSSPTLRQYQDKVTVIPGGIDIARWAAQPGPEAAALRCRVSGGRLVVLFVGRLVYYKGLEHLLRAMVRVPATLLLVGDGPLRTPLQAMAQALGITERVVFVGTVAEADLVHFYHASDVFAFPSDSSGEAFGFAMLEAQAAGLPAVSTDLPTGVTLLNRHGETGLVVEPGNADALADALTILVLDGALRRRLGDAARCQAITRFDMDTCAARMIDLYRDVLHRRDRVIAATPST